MRNTTTTVVIAAGAVLAAVIVTRTPAQVSLAGSGTACCLPDGGCQVVTPADCLSMGGIPNASGQPNCSFIVCAPIPTVVALALHDRGFPRISRAWSDGQVDVTVIDDNVCDATILCSVVVIPGSCPTDVDRNGDTGINDFLALLGGWGECR